MDYEVELKYRMTSLVDVLARLEGLGVTFEVPMQQQDAYFNHPSRDFAQTDEAFRIRSVDTENRLTYKGPKVDAQTKTRLENEVTIESGHAAREQMAAMLTSLGFRQVRTITKQRRSGHLQWEDLEVEVAIDEVLSIGQFIELEAISGESSWQTVRDSLLRLADHLKLTDPERRSYLELHLESE